MERLFGGSDPRDLRGGSGGSTVAPRHRAPASTERASGAAYGNSTFRMAFPIPTSAAPAMKPALTGSTLSTQSA